MSSVFDLRAHFAMDHFPHYEAFLRLFAKLYGVRAPHHWYLQQRRALLDRAAPDPFGITRYATLDDWWEAQRLTYHYQQGEPDDSCEG